MGSAQMASGWPWFRWKQARDAFAEEQKAKEEKTEMKEGEEAEDTKTKAADAAATESALVVSQARSSSWDRFGAGLRDMSGAETPFLNSVFENPLLDRVFGETEQAEASIRTPADAMGGGISSEAVDAEAEPLRKLLDTSMRGFDTFSCQEYWLKEELARLREREHKLSHEKHYWRTYARQLEQEKSELVKTHFFGAIRLESRLTSHKEEVYEPHSYSQDYKWYKTSCPCCRRPVEVTVTSLSRWQPRRARGRRAFVVVLWGANAGYALGALVLGLRLKELSPYIERVMLHTDDVPRNYLEALGEFWQLKEVDYIDGVEDLYVGKGNIFDGVFTKLGAWTLEEFEKVLLLDLDIIPLRAMDELFELPCPAAMVRGQGVDKGAYLFPCIALEQLVGGGF
ncbi:unnamed protein product [Effrenium voratum]|nr:unnamed protein product [Effrenium voratum]